jgi:AraC-like DNA-binding protein
MKGDAPGKVDLAPLTQGAPTGIASRREGRRLRETTVAASLVIDLVAHLADRGLEPAEVCRAARLDNYLLRRPRQVLETLAAGVVRALAELPREPVRALEVRFRHPAPASTVEHRRLLGVEPRFGQAADLLVFRSADLASPLRSAHPALLAVFERHAEEQLARLDDLGPLARRTLAAITARLRGGLPVLGEVASELAQSARNLQRGLAAEGTSFQDLLERARRELALGQLAATSSSVAEVAFLVGFSDASAFTRAFRRWTGQAPSEWRAHQRAGAAGRSHRGHEGRPAVGGVAAGVRCAGGHLERFALLKRAPRSLGADAHLEAAAHHLEALVRAAVGVERGAAGPRRQIELDLEQAALGGPRRAQEDHAVAGRGVDDHRPTARGGGRRLVGRRFRGHREPPRARQGA